VAVSAAGLAAAGTATALAGTARVEAHGMVIPALHDAASDRPTPYTPVCAGGAVQICLQPAYRGDLPEVTAALGALLHQLAGLPGAPARVAQVVVTSVQSQRENGIGFGGPVISGRPPVLYLPLSGLTLPGEGSTPAAAFISSLRVQYGSSIVNDLVGLPSDPGFASGASGIDIIAGQGPAAKLAIAGALERVFNLVPPAHGAVSAQPPRGASIPGREQLAASKRFAALSAARRHAWLLTHLAALRAGRVTLSEIP
jgi:hypothetical protein